jgi:hypothetical protein
MSFDIKISRSSKDEPSPQQKKLNRLIDQIEQQKISLAAWQNAQAEIQQHTRQKLMPVYSELHEILFQQLDQLWNCYNSMSFPKRIYSNSMRKSTTCPYVETFTNVE